MKPKLLPPSYVFSALVAIVVLHVLCPLTVVLAGLYRLAGLLPLGLGIFLNGAADQAFKSKQTTVKPFERSTTLITEGVFGWTRNPMYLGMTLILLGLTMGLGTLSPFVVVILFAIVMDKVFIRPEEAKMMKDFGSAFQRYKQKVRRWI